MSTVLIYNDVRLEVVKMNSFTQEPMYTEDRAEYLYTKYTIDCQCVFSIDTHGTATAATALNQRRLALLSPGKTLDIKSGGQSWLNVIGPDIGVGPKPLSLVVTKVAGARTFVCSYQIEAFKTDCTSIQDNNGMLSNRWSMSVSFDADLMQTRTLTGVLMRDPRVPINDLFPFVIPILPKKWKREAMTFNITPDGTRIDYVVTDKEVYTVAPKPATQARGHYSWGVSKFGTRATAEIDVTLRGNNSTNPAELVTKATAIVISRANLQPANGVFQDYIVQFSVSENLFENEISVKAVIEKVNDLKKLDGFLIDAQTIGKAIPGTETNESFDWTDNTTPIAALVTQLLRQTPCEPPLSTSTIVRDIDTEEQATTTTTEITATTGTITSEGEAAVTGEHKAFMYGDYEIDVQYESDDHSFLLPVAGPSPQDSVRVQVAAPSTRKIVTFVARRYGAFPQIPSFVSATDQGFLISHEVRPAQPKLLPNGEDYEFSIAGRYVYGLVKAMDTTMYPVAPRSPEATREVEENAITDAYRTDITGDGFGAELGNPMVV